MRSRGHGAALDTALINGTVYRTPGDAQPGQAIGVCDGTVACVGSRDDVSAMIGPRTEVRDLSGRAVTPAFIESHTHFHRGAVLQHLYLDFDQLRPADVSTQVVPRDRHAEAVVTEEDVPDARHERALLHHVTSRGCRALPG